MKTFKEHIEETEVNEGKNEWEEAYKEMEGVKTAVGVKIQDLMKDYQSAVIKIQLLPSGLKPYFEEAGLEFPEKQNVNNLITWAGTFKKLTNAKLK